MRSPIPGLPPTALLLLAFVTTVPLAGQSTATLEPAVTQGIDFPLTIASIMRGPELVGESPTAVRWTDDGRWIYFRWRPGGGKWSDQRDLYRVGAAGGEPEKIAPAAADSLAVLFAPGALSPDRRQRVSEVGGDLYLVDRRTMGIRRLTRTTDAERSPSFSRDGRTVLFNRQDNTFALSLTDGSIRQLTDLRPGPAPAEEKEPEGHRAFLRTQQEELFEHIRTDRQREAREKEERERREAAGLRPTHLARGERVQSLDPNATGTYVAVTVTRPEEDAERVNVPDWVTTSGYTEDIRTRTKVGDALSATRIGILDTSTGETLWLSLPLRDETVEDENGPALSTLAFVAWNDAGSHGLIQAVSYDYNYRWLYAVDAGSGEVTVLDELFDEAWVAGPCFFGCAGWLPGSGRAYFVGEESGYAHLYTIAPDGSDLRQITSGPWEVLSVEIPEARNRFILRTNETSPFDQHVYRMEFDGSGRTALTSGDGSFDATPSPDASRMAVVHSRSNRPPELFVGPMRAGADLQQVTVSPTPEWLVFPWKEAEIVHVTAEDGTRVPARIYRPADVGARPNGAGVIFVHGAGYLQNVHRFWSGYYREYMFHHFLAAHGYTVLDIDYRGSAGHGRDWRTAIYRWMGGKDLSDQVDGARYLAASEGVDPARVGIYGGSYGGFITLMALFTAPDHFKAGAALRSVTDWAHYNHPYTGRILNLPQEDEEAYERSSPIYFAENFRPDQHLLMAHGMVDTNVHFSDVVRLSQRLIELGKENWELAVYPVESHGFVEPTSWTDEYRRIFELFERTIGGR